MSDVTIPAEIDEDGNPAHPEGYGFLALIRHIERHAKGKPRIGRNLRLRDEIARLGQDPFLAFPDSDLSEVSLKKGKPVVRARFLGFFGPHGAMPLNTTEEVLQWVRTGDRAFVEFTDIFTTRFQQLFYRSWADPRPIAQFDHPDDDRFQTYLLSMCGFGTPAQRDRDRINDTIKLRMMPLFLGRVKSPVKLRQMLELHFKTKINIEEMMPSWMEFEPDTLCNIGQQASSLGRNMHLGSRVQSVNEKICIHIYSKTIDAYRRLLPGGPDNVQMVDIINAYLGRVFDVDVALWLPRIEVKPAKLGETAELGWMACITPPSDAISEEEMVRGALYRLDPDTITRDELNKAA